jgi:Spy/CpxP family protein refolding chaperone
MMAVRSCLIAVLCVGALGVPASRALAQGDLTAPTPTGRPIAPTNRLDILAASLGLTKDQKNTAKALMEEASKNAAPVRARLASTRAALGTSIETGQSQAEITAAIKAHAAEITAMTSLEMKTLARVLELLTPEQRTVVQQTGIRAPFYLFRGAFVEEKWNVAPKTGAY